ncbi:MAG: hypothetical protein KKF67_01200, partial [Nanoarchaeota archaeon]|nr:hypothetical protein [Nanoarchaeota archaeon]
LLASTYASLINAPLVIEGTSLDSDNIFVNRNIICVGDVDRACNEQYTLEQLQGRYVELTQTDKIVLVNPNDLDMHINEFFPTEKLDRVNQIYSKTSLAAPILASAKHEVMTFTNNYDYLQADQEFTNQFLNMYNFQQSDFHTIECRFGDACSSEPDIYRIPVKQSIGDTVSYRFNTNGINNYENLHFGYLYTDASCGLENGDDAFVTINSNEYRAYLNIGEMPNGELFSLGKYMFFNLGRDELDEGLFADSLWDVEIRIPGCRIFRRTDVWYGDNILTATGNGGMRQVIDFEEETNIQDGEIEVLGLNEGNSAFFNFENLNPNLDYKIVVTTSRSNLCENGEEFCRGTFIDNEFTTYIRGSQIEDGRVEIEVRGGDSLQENYHILPITSVQLYPQISEHYLTILASPDAIQMSRSSGFTMFQSEINYQLEIYYETIDNQYNPFPSIGNVVRLPEDANNYRLLTGRIFGISLSDVSGNIARNLFFDKIPKDKSASFIWRGISADTTADEIRNSLNSNSENLIYDEFPDGVYTCYSYNDPEVGCDIDIPELVQSYIDSYFTLYSDHGSYNWAGVSSSALRYKYLQPKTSYISACSTCDFVDAKNRNNAQNLLCMQILRRGGLNYIGSQSIARISSSGSSIPSEVSSMVLDKEIIGRVWESHQKRAQGWDIYYVLIGDPTFKPIYWDEPRSEE